MRGATETLRVTSDSVSAVVAGMLVMWTQYRRECCCEAGGDVGGVCWRGAAVVVVDAALRCQSKLSELEMVRVGQSSRASRPAVRQ